MPVSEGMASGSFRWRYCLQQKSSPRLLLLGWLLLLGCRLGCRGEVVLLEFQSIVWVNEVNAWLI